LPVARYVVPYFKQVLYFLQFFVVCLRRYSVISEN